MSENNPEYSKNSDHSIIVIKLLQKLQTPAGQQDKILRWDGRNKKFRYEWNTRQTKHKQFTSKINYWKYRQYFWMSQSVLILISFDVFPAQY